MDHKSLITFLLLLASTCCFTQNWEEMAPLPDTTDGRNHPITFALNGFGYFGGGSSSGSTSAENSFFKYDPDLNSWESINAFPGPKRSFSYGVTIGNAAFAGFGLYIADDFDFTYFNDLWSFNAGNNSWNKLKSCPCEGRSHPAMIAIGTEIYVGLGTSNGADLNDWWAYDLLTNEWTQKPDFPGDKRHHPYYFEIDGIAYVGLGHGWDIFRDFYKYDPETELWTQLEDFPSQGRVAGTQFSLFGKGYILSGEGEDHNSLPTGEFWQYDPELDFWFDLPSHPGVGRWAPGSFVIGTDIYLAGGRTNSDKKDLWRFNLDPLAIENPTLETEISFYPNPSAASFHILTDLEILQILVYDSTGKFLFENNKEESIIDLTNFPAGNYFINIRTSRGSLNQKLLRF